MLAAIGTALAIGVGGAAAPAPAHAAAGSASINGTTATLNLDGADDNVTVSVVGGLLVHGQAGGGLNSGSDWNSAAAGDQTVPANGTFDVVVNGGDGNDVLTVLAKNTEIAGATLNGEGGDDVLTGADSNDRLAGGDGNDRLTGAKGTDQMGGGNGNDTLVWNNGDGSDTVDGDAGNDATEVNGNPTLGDVFTVAPNAGRIKFQRTNLVPFTLDSSTERFQVNGLGGDDFLAASDGVGALTLLSVDGGAGTDTISGSDGPDLIQGGEGNDVLSGGGGDDRIVGDRGNDTMNGGAGDDTLVWNNGDGSDIVNGGAGRDDVEVNGAPTADDAFTVRQNGARIGFKRTNLVPFALDIGTSETMHANGLGGDDTIDVGNVGAFAVTAAGGSGNDKLLGGASSDTLLGGSGDDTIDAGSGLDVVSGDDGNDHVDVRDNRADLAFGGAGSDSVIADGNDLLDGFEAVDQPHQVIPPAPAATPVTQPVAIRGGTVKVSRKKPVAAIRVSCPAGSAGNCVGTVEVRTAKAVRIGGLTAVVELGSARYDLAPGGFKTVKVKLAKGVQHLADRHGHIAVRAEASTGASGRIATSTRRLKLALGR
jgi:Ca2+-binding RTX toxin-like protein